MYNYVIMSRVDENCVTEDMFCARITYCKL